MFFAMNTCTVDGGERMEKARNTLRTIRDRMVVNAALVAALIEVAARLSPEFAAKADALLGTGSANLDANLSDLAAVLALLSV